MNPNRVAIYVTAFADIVAALLVIFASLGVEEIVGVLTAGAAINAKVLMWLRGWQQMEKAEMQARLIHLQNESVADIQAREAELAAKAGKAGRQSKVTLPR